MPATDLLEKIDLLRLDANRGLGEKRADLGQFMTPASVARLMASLIAGKKSEIRILDAGAGVGSLSAAAVEELCGRKNKPKSISVTVFELDPHLITYLSDTMQYCEQRCQHEGIEFNYELCEGDFLEAAAERLAEGLFSSTCEPFDCAILNPPYRKINSGSRERALLSQIGIETTNLYTGFLAAAIRLLAEDGELVAITPRSFCNGTYFRGFREFLLDKMELKHLHVFESRKQAFQEDAVLQENLIFHAIRRKGKKKPGQVVVTASDGPDDELPRVREVGYEQIVYPNDPQAFIHVPADNLSDHVIQRMSLCRSSLQELGIKVSTGRVVDFRVKEHLREKAGKGTYPLIWPAHFDRGYVRWPKPGVKKPEAIAACTEIDGQMLPNEHYVLVRRFSAKEEHRRVVAAIYDSERVPGECVGFENHLNYYHNNGRGLDLTLARGLAAYLNSTLVDTYFRQFNGHTQVNATDLRGLGYPDADKLRAIGKRVGEEFPDQTQIDSIVSEELGMADSSGIDPALVKKKVDEGLAILKALGLPRAQINERSALTLLALLNLKPDSDWSNASDPLCGITPMMDFFRDFYGKSYKPNTRETVRRQTVHQFLDAGLIVANPDNPERPVNSPKAVYQIEASALELLRGFGGKSWEADLAAYLSSVKTLKEKYAQEREMARIPVSLALGKDITLSPGGQNVLVKEIIDQFAPRFASPGKFIYVGDTDEKYAYFDKAALLELGVDLDSHGKMPDVIIHYTEKNWLLLIEAVTSHGPINPKRHSELKTLFKNSSAGLVYVTTFLTRKAMIAYLDEISWETEVWVAESPTHMIHFNGVRFLGPYPE